MATFSVYVCWQMTVWGVPLYVSIFITMLISFVIGAVVFRLFVRPILDAPEETIVVSCIGLFVAFGAICLWIWGSDSAQFPRLFSDKTWWLGSVRISANNLGILLSLTALAATLGLVFKLTRTGLAMQAAAMERGNSPFVGIEVERMLMLGWGFASVVAFVAGVLAAPSLFLSPVMMFSVVIYALAAASLGGWDSPAGAIVGGLILGVAESVGTTFIPAIGADLRLAIPFLLMIIVLAVRPQGLFGHPSITRV
jgi:branched-chain amino acid transport system permease protein